jgi:hypothetical protein
MLRLKSIFIITAILITISLSGCSEDSDPIAPQEEHFEPVGMVIFDSGIKVLDYYAPDFPTGTTEIGDTIKISIGLSPHYTLKFYDETKALIDPPTDPDMTFGAVFSNASIAQLQWDAGEEGSFAFHINGLAVGITKAEFQILHAGHADFRTLLVPILVQ